MIEKIQNLPENVVGFNAIGKVTAGDYEAVIIPSVEEKFAKNEKVRFLCNLGDDFSGIEAGAMWDDAKLGIKHFTGWEKMAVATDVEWIRATLKFFGLVMPGEVRVFKKGELDEATRWVCE